MTTNHFPHTAQTEWTQPTLLADVLDLRERVADLTARVTAAEDGQGDALRAEFADVDHEAGLLFAAHALHLPLHQVRTAYAFTRQLDAVALAAITPHYDNQHERDQRVVDDLENLRLDAEGDDAHAAVCRRLFDLDKQVRDLEDGPVYRLAHTIAVLAEHLRVDLIGLLADAGEAVDITVAVENRTEAER
jgi:hypothetical protein